MNYSTFEVHDFATDESFVRWVLEGDPEAAGFWEHYKKTHPESVVKIDKARDLLLNLRKAEQTLQTPAKVEKIWQRIDADLFTAPVVKKSPNRVAWTYRVAASVAFLATVLFTLYWFQARDWFGTNAATSAAISTGEGFIEEVNTTERVIRIHLSDGSMVDLEKNSRLLYRKDHRGHPLREVYLTGEAFFDIAENPQQPFLVHADGLVTKVLGTSFRVKAMDNDKNIVVSVKAGKVSVYSSREKKKMDTRTQPEVNGVVLTPNQQVVYTRDEDSFTKTLVEAPEVVNEAVQRAFVFRNAPVKEVFTVLEKAYDVDIIFNEAVMDDCYLTVPLGDEPLFDKLKIICRTVGATYELIDTKIVISSTGCKEIKEDE